MNDFTKENLDKAKKIIADNKGYNEEKDLLIRIQMFELYKFAKKWVKKYEPSVPDTVSSEWLRVLEKDEIGIGEEVYLLGSDGIPCLLTIVHDSMYHDENNQLSETEAQYYQEQGELYVYER